MQIEELQLQEKIKTSTPHPLVMKVESYMSLFSYWPFLLFVGVEKIV